MAGWHKASIAYTSNGQRRYNQPFTPTPYGLNYFQGDVIGVGYRPRTGTVFFTRNGKKLDDVVHGLKTQNFFPTVGANGPCTVHVNFGQSGFVFIEANVKKWGLAPMMGSLAPPPPYGSEQGSILLEAGRESAQTGQGGYYGAGHGRSRSRFGPIGGPTSPGPMRSPTDISLAQLEHIPSHEDVGEGSSHNVAGGANSPTATGSTPVADQGLAINPHDYSAPPPDYTSPEGSRRSSETSEDDERSLLSTPSPRPPVPSYDVAMRGEPRTQREEDDRSETSESP